jgi:hypothetical protein
MKTTKRIAAWLVAIAMIMTLMPMTAMSVSAAGGCDYVVGAVSACGLATCSTCTPGQDAGTGDDCVGTLCSICGEDETCVDGDDAPNCDTDGVCGLATCPTCTPYIPAGTGTPPCTPSAGNPCGASVCDCAGSTKCADHCNETHDITLPTGLEKGVYTAEIDIAGIGTAAVTLAPSDATLAPFTVAWTSSNTAVATITGTGLTATITGVAAGSATITAQLRDGTTNVGASVTFVITVGTAATPDAIFTDDVVISGLVGVPLNAGTEEDPKDFEVTIELQDDNEFKEIAAGANLSGWFLGANSLPGGLTATAKDTAETQEITIVIKGTPTAARNAPLVITIPAAVLEVPETGTIIVTDPNVKFEILSASITGGSVVTKAGINGIVGRPLSETVIITAGAVEFNLDEIPTPGPKEPIPTPCDVCDEDPCVCEEPDDPCDVCDGPCECPDEPDEPCADCSADPCECDDDDDTVVDVDGFVATAAPLSASTLFGEKDVSDWFNDLPEGLAAITTATSTLTSITVTIAGTPIDVTQGKDEEGDPNGIITAHEIKVVIPAEHLIMAGAGEDGLEVVGTIALKIVPVYEGKDVIIWGEGKNLDIGLNLSQETLVRLDAEGEIGDSGLAINAFQIVGAKRWTAINLARASFAEERRPALPRLLNRAITGGIRVTAGGLITAKGPDRGTPAGEIIDFRADISKRPRFSEGVRTAVSYTAAAQWQDGDTWTLVNRATPTIPLYKFGGTATAPTWEEGEYGFLANVQISHEITRTNRNLPRNWVKYGEWREWELEDMVELGDDGEPVLTNGEPNVLAVNPLRLANPREGKQARMQFIVREDAKYPNNHAERCGTNTTNSFIPASREQRIRVMGYSPAPTTSTDVKNNALRGRKGIELVAIPDETTPANSVSFAQVSIAGNAVAGVFDIGEGENTLRVRLTDKGGIELLGRPNLTAPTLTALVTADNPAITVNIAFRIAATGARPPSLPQVIAGVNFAEKAPAAAPAAGS